MSDEAGDLRRWSAASSRDDPGEGPSGSRTADARVHTGRRVEDIAGRAISAVGGGRRRVREEAEERGAGLLGTGKARGGAPWLVAGAWRPAGALDSFDSERSRALGRRLPGRGTLGMPSTRCRGGARLVLSNAARRDALSSSSSSGGSESAAVGCQMLATAETASHESPAPSANDATPRADNFRIEPAALMLGSRRRM